MNRTRKHTIDMMVADWYTTSKKETCSIIVTQLNVVGDSIQEVEENLKYAIENGIEVVIANSNLVINKPKK